MRKSTLRNLVARKKEERRRTFDTLVNLVAREMDGDSDYNEAFNHAIDHGANHTMADLVARELGRKPEKEIASTFFGKKLTFRPASETEET